jgi:purine-binding chemotaxis protein CheW
MTEAERYRALLDLRSAALAARGRSVESSVDRRDFLLCAIGAERFGIPLTAIAGVLPERACTRLPGAPAALRGIIAHAGTIVSVIDLAGALGLGRDDGTREPGHFLRVRADGPPLALAVDRVIGVSSVEAGSVTASPTAGARDGVGAEAVSGYAPASLEHEGGFAIIDLPRLLRPFQP